MDLRRDTMLRILIVYSILTFYQHTLDEEHIGRAALLVVMYEHTMQVQGPWRHGSDATINGFVVSESPWLRTRSRSSEEKTTTNASDAQNRGVLPRRCMDCKLRWRNVRTAKYIFKGYCTKHMSHLCRVTL